jgi:hypothetical protein
VPSPLDSDFFDLLQRLEPNDADQPAVDFVLRQGSTAEDFELRKSMERMFYTLHLRAYLRQELLHERNTAQQTEEVIANFARALQSLLRSAHGKRKCEHHIDLLQHLGEHDAVISFNYDLVVERALKQIALKRKQRFTPAIYGFEKPKPHLPLVLKLHGSSNWSLQVEGEISVRQETWSDFDAQPGYRGHKGEGTVFPIMLPFWDKRIERKPWRGIWSRAAAKLSLTSRLIVWGYSLPMTDVKSRELFRVSIPTGGKGVRLCVIDPSAETRQRWRNLLPNAQFWEYERFNDFRRQPPTWW